MAFVEGLAALSIGLADDLDQMRKRQSQGFIRTNRRETGLQLYGRGQERLYCPVT